MKKPLKIVIVGGVAGGASAAARARRVNEHAEITLLEKDAYVSFANCGLPYYIGGEIEDREKLFVARPQKFKDWFNIDVRVRNEALSIDTEKKSLRIRDHEANREYDLEFDKLILSPGAEPIIPPIPGSDAQNVFGLRSVMDADRIKSWISTKQPKRAVVVGGGFIGLEMVEMLAGLGIGVSIIEREAQLLMPLDSEMAALVAQTVKNHGVDLQLSKSLSGLRLSGEATPSGPGIVDGVVLADGSVIETELVILALGVRPATKLAKMAGLQLGATGGIAVNDYLQTSHPDVYAVGDAVEYLHSVADLRQRVPLAGPANRAGRIAGEHAATGNSPPMPPVLGTAIVRVFETVAAVTGCNQRCLAQAGTSASAVWTPGNSHASYYPGAEEMMLKIIYSPDTGKLLGAQAVGGDGVDKRIDILATAIQLGGTVESLTALDLTYAPPFGSAKDPIHQVGYCAENQRRVLNQFIPPTQVKALPSGTQLLDVRTLAEWKSGALEGAIHIPLPELRRRLGELDPSRPVVTYCRGGQRAYFATRILRQQGFSDVQTLSGGMLLQGAR